MTSSAPPGAGTALILPLTNVGRVDEVVRRISQAIRLGLVADGEQLPAETDFAAQLGVSPMTLREALALLRHDGLVETRRGRSGGTFVRRPTAPALDSLRTRLAGMSVTTLRDLADEQGAISGTAARLAAERASPASLRRIVRLVDQLAESAALSARIRADSRFHIEIAVASQSERLVGREVELQYEVADLLWLPDGDDQAHLDSAVKEHHEIATAIAAEDGEQARLLTERHIQHNLRRLTRLHLVQGDGDE